LATTGGSIAIHAAGLSCSLGLDIRNACAGARAGLTRLVEFTAFPTQAPDGDESSLLCHALPLVTLGFEGDARLAQIMAPALANLFHEAPGLRDARFPIPFYLATQAEPTSDEDDEPVPADESEVRAQAAERVAAALHNAGVAATADVRYASEGGRPAFGQALAAATADIVQGRCQLAVVGAVDTLLNADRLNELNDSGRLKTPDHAAGLQAGEAGAFLLLSAKGSAKRWSSHRPVGVGKGLTANDNGSGRGLGDLLHQLLPPDASLHWLVTDQNGEYERALEYGNAFVRLRAHGSGERPVVTWAPSESFGDCGAAATAVAFCAIFQAFQRGYAPAARAVVTEISDAATRAAIELQLS